MSDPLPDLIDALVRRVETAPEPARAEQAEQIRRHVADYLSPRAADLSAPLVVVVLGSTGVGKSSLFNAIAGESLSETGLIRPTTRRPVALVHPADAPALERTEGEISWRDQVDVRVDPAIAPGLVVVDAPDFDSVEASNRQLAVQLLEIADLVIFVTTVTRYADQVPWDILARARQRGVPLLAVINRMPADDADAASVLSDYRSLIERGELDRQGAFGRLEVVSVPEGALDRGTAGLDRDAVKPILDSIERLRRDDAERRSLARRSLETALAGLPEAVEPIAAEVEREQQAAASLLQVLEANYVAARRAVDEEIESGTFLRGEVLRQWLDFVNAGPVARYISEGVGRIAAAIRNVFRSAPPPPAPEVREAAFADLVSSVGRHVDAAAAKTAATWVEDPHGARALAENAGLWGASPDLSARLERRLDRWMDEIGEEIRVLGERRKVRAQAASIGLNVVGTGAILAVFIQTGGLTGAEVGIAGATAVLNQKLLEAIFGEANVAAFVNRSRERLDEILESVLAAERGRFVAALGTLAEPTDLASELRRTAHAASRLEPR